MEVDADALAEVTFENSEAFGVTPDELVADDWAACQAMAERARADGVAGLIVPSAALPGTRNLVLFGPRIASPYLISPIDPSLDSPTAHAAEGSVPPGELFGLVRWHGEPHVALESWRAGLPFRFLDPMPLRS